MENASYLQKAQGSCYICKNSEAAHDFKFGSYWNIMQRELLHCELYFLMAYLTEHGNFYVIDSLQDSVYTCKLLSR